MDEDNGIQAPVTRLRRRLSVEQSEETKSPGPATPTKKRGGRLAAKPHLELINENMNEDNIATKKATKKGVKDLEATEEKPLTPARRSTRIKSNTSILSETAQNSEEKPLTPARRSTRIKSNTSILSETAQNYDSPRAKRAARRISQVGSDNESTSTPVRQTRKTRRDSSSSVDKLGSDNESTSAPVRQTRKTRKDSSSSGEKLELTLASNPKFDSCIITVIVEETDTIKNGSETGKGKNEIVLRTSPRLKEKIHEKGKAKKMNDSNEEIAGTSNNALNDTTNKILNNSVSAVENPAIADNNDLISEKEPQHLLNTSPKIIQEITDNSKRRLSEGNKSKTKLEDQNNFESKMHKADDSQSNKNDSLLLDDNNRNNKAVTEIEVTNNRVVRTEKEQKELSLTDTSLNTIKTLGGKSKQRLSDSDVTVIRNHRSTTTKRQKTISLTSTTQSEINDSAFFSDNEKSKKKVDKKDKEEVFKSFKNKTDKEDKEEVFKGFSPNKHSMEIDSNNLCPTKVTYTELDDLHQMKLNSSVNNETKEILDANTTPISNKSPNISFKSPSNKLINIESQLETAENTKIIKTRKNSGSNTKLLEKPSQTILQSADMLQDSYRDIKSKVTNMHLYSEDQCVPVVETRESGENPEHIYSISIEKSNNKMNASKTGLQNSSISNESKEQNPRNESCEPMDIDVTIPNTETLQLNKTSESVKPVTSFSEVNGSLINKSNEKSKGKSSVFVQNLEKSETENKSTLIISQINDVSSSENNISKSPQLCQEDLSKSTSSDINKEKIIDKKRLSLEQYSTSTPLQQKHIKKLEMQINTYKNESKKSDDDPNPYNKDISIISKSRELNSSSSSESEKNSSRRSMLDDEAGVASDDYESGDSQDEDERQYEAENEVLEKGETLDSDEEFSNDSDYEKDSFVISSNEEDQELLSGSGDDLSMSDNELTMSKKSKEKYNTRKIKEQKKASKEMFDARHKLDKSGNKPDIKKSLQRSGILESSEDEIEPKKKYKHRRLNSTNEDDLNDYSANKSLSKRAKKNRLLSESQSECNESISKEQEITVFNNSAVDDDPLSTKVKQEPKTPLKELSISTVQINDNIEEVEVENNVSFSKTNQTLDPLCNVMVDENSSSLSENPDIANNYDSILNQLNNECVKYNTHKSHHFSMIMDRESKKTKASILEELNVTHTKKSKQNKKSNSVDVIDAPQTIKVAKKAKNNKISKNVDKDSSSDSIDMKLLFSEESTDLDTDKGQTIQTKKKKDSADDFIPLKRTPGKTNIINKQDDEQSSNSDLKFIIDTEGSKQKTDDSWNVLLTNSAKKKNKKAKLPNISQENLVTQDEGANREDEDGPLEAPIESSKNEKSRKSINTTDSTEKQKQDMVEHMTQDISPHELDSAKKKKKKPILEISEGDELSVDPQTLNASLSAGRQKKKRKMSQHDTSNQSKGERANGEDEVGPLEISIESSKNEKSRKSVNTTDSTEKQKQDMVDCMSQDISLHELDSAKKNKKKPILEISEIPTEVVSNTKKRKRKSSTNNNTANDFEKEGDELSVDLQTLNASLSAGRQKKKRKISQHDASNQEGDELSVDPQTLNTSLSAGRQKKKRKISQHDASNQGQEDTEKAMKTGDINEQASLEKTVGLEEAQPKKNMKRKQRDDDVEISKAAKKIKEHKFGKIPRLPTSILNQLEDKPNKAVLDMKKSQVISTTPFNVQETIRRKNKPSIFLEESVYLNESREEKKKKVSLKKPTVLPFVPTAATSEYGFTTQFKINIIPQEVQFVAQSSNVNNYKNDYIYGKKIKRLGTYEMLKKHRTAKISKF